MSVRYLYYTEDTATGGYLSPAHAVPWLDQMAYMYGGSLMCVHPPGAPYEATTTEQYPTLAAAHAAYPTHTWVYLDNAATAYLDTLTHPADNVVYAVGHEVTGYGGETLNGSTYKLRTTRPEPFEGYSAVCLALAIAERWRKG